jgi:hypothetical protein
MPSLIPSAWTTVHPVIPYVWSCSECQAAFGLGSLRYASATQEQIDKINLEFQLHCKQVHPRLFPVVLL